MNDPRPAWAAWTELASHDLETAVFIQSAVIVRWEIVGFHAQQAAEKYLKALLVSFGDTPPKTHDLAELVGLCEQHDPSLGELTEECAFLSPQAVSSRYPDSPHEPTRDDALRGVEISGRVRDAILARLQRREE